MGKIITRKLEGMSWWARTGLVLLLTLATSVFMYEGWYIPKQAQAASNTITTTGASTWVAPAGVASVSVAAWAGGGGGGGSSTTSATVGGGGAGGQYVLKVVSVTPGVTYNLSVGAGGAAGANTGGNGGTGGDTWFNTTATVIAKGGAGGTGAATTGAKAGGTGSLTGGIGTTVYAGGSGSASNITGPESGAGGGGAGSTGAGGNATGITAGTGTTVSGGNGAAGRTTSGVGSAGSNFGGGGGGSRNNGTTARLGGAGAPGQIILTYTAVTDSTAPTVGTVTITPDVSGYTSAAPTITTVFTDTQSAVTTCQYTTNGSTWSAGNVTGTGPYTCTANPAGLSGSLTINMRATSSGGQGTATSIARTVDTAVPTDGTLTVTPSSTQNSLSWTAATDTGGSGIGAYILRFATGATAPLTCTAGTAVSGSPFGSAVLSATHTGLTNSTQYSYRLCAQDSMGNVSGGTTGTGTPAACTDSDPATLAITSPVTAGTVTGTVIVSMSVGVETVPAGMTSVQFQINGSWRNATWNAGTAKWEYSWNTLTDYPTSNVAAVSGVTINAHGTDPDCGAVKTATTVTVTVNNVGSATGITLCGGCHGHPAGPNLLVDSNRAASAGTFQGSHSEHAPLAADCAKCHTNPTRMDHSSGAIEVAISAGGTYSKASPITISTSPTLTGGTCSSTTCHGTSSPTWGTSTTQATCTKCHGVLNTTPAVYTADPKFAAPGYSATATVGRDTAGLTAATGAQVGAHDIHLRGVNAIANPVACTECHSNVSTTSTTFTGHMDGVGTLSFGTLATSGTGTAPSYASGTGTCSNTYCHFGRTTYAPTTTNGAVVWNNTAAYLTGVPTNDCQKCHASPPSATGIHAGKAFPSSCNACHSHVSTAGVITDPTLHINGAVNASGGHAFPYQGATHMTAAGSTPWSSCSCHNTTATGVTYATWAASGTTLTRAAPNCATCHLGGLKVPVGTSSCWDCHGASATNAQPNGGVAAFPNYSGNHPAHVTRYGMVCSSCHNGKGGGVNDLTHGNSNAVAKTRNDVSLAFNGNQATPVYTSGTLTCTAACHVAAVWGTHLDCVSCHSSTVVIGHGTLANGTNTRRAVATEVQTSGTKNHKSTAIGSAATKWDCIVCHMEGNASTGEPDAAFHGNGYLNFRDPDSGTEIRKVKWTGLGPLVLNDAGGRYVDVTPFSAFTTSRFSRDLSKTFESDPNWLKLASIQMNLCLKCHDNDGAASTLAQNRNAAGNALLPFGNTSVGSTLTQVYVTATTGTNRMTAAGNLTGAVMNVFSQFSTANASYHPVRGRQNNGFAKGASMQAPWNGGTPAKSPTVYGYLVSCFDCHAARSATGIQTGTVIAHGNGSTSTTPMLRATNYAATTNLCTVCHAATYAGSTNHGTNSAFGSGGASAHNTQLTTCFSCHSNANGTSNSTNLGSRASDAHGFDAMGDTGSATNTFGTRPYSFIRARGPQGNWRPGTCASTSGCTSTGTYSPGGAY